MRKAWGLLLLLFLSGNLRGADEVRTVLVFPFENQSPRTDLNWISESFALMLSTRLGIAQNYTLGRDERIAACQQLGIPPETPLTLASEFKVAQTLGVDWAVVGNFTVEGDRFTARAQLLEMRALKLAPAIEATGALADLADIQTRLAWRLLATHDPAFTVGSEEDFVKQFPEVRLDAFENYVRGILSTEDEARIHFFQEADRLTPNDHRAAFQLGRLYFDQKDYASSAKWFQKLDSKDPDYLESLFLSGVDEYFLGHAQPAEKLFDELAQEIPLSEVSNNLAVLWARRGHYAEALANFQRAAQTDPSDPDFSFNEAVCFWYMKRYTDAAQVLQDSLRANDDDSEAHGLLAITFKRLGDAASEQRERKWLADHEEGPASQAPDDVTPQARIKKHFDGRAFHLLAVTVHNTLEARLAHEPPEKHSAVHVARGKKFLAEGRLPEAERELSEAVSLTPFDNEARLTYAQVLAAEGKHREAVAELETSLKLKESVAAHLNLARVFLSLDQPEQAREQTQAALRLEPTNREAAQLIQQIGAGGFSKKGP